MPAVPSITQRSLLVQWLVLGISWVLAGAVIAWSLWEDRGQVAALERERLQTQARVVARGLERALGSARQALQDIEADLPLWRRYHEAPELALRRLQAVTNAMQGVRTLAVMDAQGTVQASNRPELIGNNFRQRAYFQTIVEQPRAQALYVSEPFTTSLGAQAITLSRMLVKPDGSFGGLVNATLDATALGLTLEAVRYSSDMTVGIAHGDGRLFVAVPQSAGVFGQDLRRDGSFFSRHLEVASASVFAGAEGAAQAERLVVFQTLNPPELQLDKPLVVLVGRDQTAMYGVWRRDLAEHLVFFGAFWFVTGGGLLLYQRRQRQHLARWQEQEAQKQAISERLDLATQAAGVGVWEYDPVSQHLHWNEAMFAIHGQHARDFRPDLLAWQGCVEPADHVLTRAALDQAVQTRCPFEVGFRVVRPSGAVRSVVVKATVHSHTDGVLVRLLGTCLDVTEVLAAQNALQHRNREMAQHNQVLALVSRDFSLPQVLEVLAHQVEALHPGLLCSILLLDADGLHLRHGAAPSLSPDYVKAIDGVVIGEGVGSCGTAAFRGETVVVEDLRSHPYWANFVHLADAAGLRSCWSQPIRRADAVVLGTFAVYQRQPASPSPDEIALIERYARLAELVIERHRTQANLRVAAIAFESQESMIVTDANSVILRVNRAFTESTGYSAQEMIGQKPNLLQSGRHDVAFYQAMWASIHSTGSWSGEIWDRRKNGEVFLDWLTITAVYGADGLVTHYVGTHTDITQRKAAQDEIAHLAFYDTLTGLPNRRLLMDRLRQALASSARSERMGALLFIDLDNFKTLNDTLGHAKGDLLLEQVARRLVTCVREGDTVARLGGDEFVVMLEALSESKAEAAAQAETVGAKVLAELGRSYAVADHVHHGSASVGIALFADHQDSVDELLRRADLAMYQAKAAGRNAMRFFDPAMQAVVSARAALEADLRQGLALQQFLLHYQPQVSQAGQTVGAEALLRWRHPVRGMVAPLDFIGLAEDTGLILPLGQWVLQAACETLVRWAAMPATADLVLAVNVSARQFAQLDFVSGVLTVLAQTGARAERLKLELTESVVVDDVDEIVNKMLLLRSHGVRFSMDDFGTGYSSLSYLRRLPLDQIKIDRSFVNEVLTDTSDAAIARTIIALGTSLGLNVIAEGVETLGQRDFLASVGCLHYQGYFYSRPLARADFEIFINENRLQPI